MLRNQSSASFLVAASALLAAISCRGPEAERLERVDQAAPPLYEGKQVPGGTSVDSEVSDRGPAPSKIVMDARAAAAAAAKAKPKASMAALRGAVHQVMDDWHDAASVGDRDRYIGHFALDAVFMGTDASERWDLATFTAYVEKYFQGGKGWTYTPSNRRVTLGPEELVAWFDEELDSDGYGALRGTGVLRRVGDSWKLAHYSMTFAIPNAVSRDVVDIVKQAE